MKFHSLMYLLLFQLVISVHIASAQCKLDRSNYDLILEENFDTLTNISQLTNKWQFIPDEDFYGWGDYKDSLGITHYGEYYLPSQVTLRPNLNGGGKVLRFSATRLTTPADLTLSNDTVRHPVWVSGMMQTKVGWHYDTLSSYYDSTGFKYGMFEIRCKLSPEDCFPAFWISGVSEIDIFEYNGADQSDLFFSTMHQYFLPQPYPAGCGNIYKKSSWDDWADDFHTWSCVWTADKVTFFIDDRETKTISSSFFATHPTNHTLILNLAMREWSHINTYMDVDFVKVYKPKNNNYNVSYKSSAEHMPHNVMEGSSNAYEQVSSIHGSIAPNSNNKDQIFYRGTDDRLYETKLINGNWQVSIIPYNYPSVIPGILVQGDLVYDSLFNYILYKGQDKRIQFFNYYNGSWWHWFINDAWNTTDYDISTDPGSMDVINETGQIVYKGWDNMIHFYTWNSIQNDWVHTRLRYLYGLNEDPDADFVKGDVIVEQATKRIIYKGFDDRMQCFSLQNGIYIHSWIDSPSNPSTYKVSTSAGSIISVPSYGIYYKGQDNKLHNYTWNGSSFIHALIPHNYLAPEYIRGNLSYVSPNAITYIGADGRIQFFKQNGTQWYHWWVDDYWNTWDYTSYGSISSGWGSLCIQKIDSKIIYSRENGDLAYFLWEPCEVLNPACDTGAVDPIVIGLKSGGGNAVVQDEEFEPEEILQLNRSTIYPNPFDNKLYINIEDSDIDNEIQVFNINGELLDKYSASNIEIDTRDYLPGLYFVLIKNNNQIQRSTILKLP